MVSEKHVRGTEFGPLQLAIWKKRSRDSATATASSTSTTPSSLPSNKPRGPSYRHTLAELNKLDTGTTVQAIVFKAG
jgi:hypothetical protein